MFCGKCGTKNVVGSNFCEQCGARLEVSHQEEVRYNDESIENLKSPEGYRELVENLGAYQEVHEDFPQLIGEKKKNQKLLMIITGVLLLVAIAVAGWLFMGFQNTRAFNDFMDQAHRYLLAENLDQAEAYFLRAIEINPREAEPYLQLADIYIEWDEPERAIEILEQGRQAVPEAQRPAFDIAISDVPVTAGGEPAANEGDGTGVENGEELSFEVIWVLEPSIEADDIDFIKSRADLVQNKNFRHFSSHYAVIRRGETFGLIDYNGVIKEGMYFADVFIVAGTYGLALTEGREYDEFYPILIGGYILENGEFTPLLPRGPDGHDTFMFYYFDGLQHIFPSAYGSSPHVGMPSVPIPVRIADSIFVSSDEDFHGTHWVGSQTGLFGVFYQGQMLTDFIYTHIGSYSEGLLAVERDGRWGYINRNGDIVIPIEYDASLIDRVYDWRESVYVDRAFAYAASEGFIPLVRDGFWEMRTTTGELVIEPGRFEAIRPMVGGRSWVKKDGLWGLIEIIANYEEGDRVEVADERWRELFIQHIRNNPWNEVSNHVDHQLLFIDSHVIPQVLIDNGSTAAGMELLSFYDGELIVTILPLVFFSYIQGENIFVLHGGRMDHFFDNVGSLQRGRVVFNEMGFWEFRGSPEQHFYWYSGIVPRENWFDEEQRNRFVSVSEEEYYRRLEEAFDFSRTSNWWAMDRDRVDVQEIIRIIEGL